MFRKLVLSVLIADLIFNVEGCSSIASFVDFVSEPITPEKDVGDNLVIIGGCGIEYRYGPLSDIEAVNLDEGNINCDPTDLPYKVWTHASVYTPVLDGILTCGGEDANHKHLSKCILKRIGNDSNHFPALNLKREWFSLTSLFDTIYAIGGYPNKNTMETINLNTDRQWKQEELPFSVSFHCSVGLGDNIIVIGGLDENYNASKIISKFSWTKKSLMKNGQSNSKRKTLKKLLVTFNNSIFPFSNFSAS